MAWFNDIGRRQARAVGSWRRDTRALSPDGVFQGFLVAYLYLPKAFATLGALPGPHQAGARTPSRPGAPPEIVGTSVSFSIGLRQDRPDHRRLPVHRRAGVHEHVRGFQEASRSVLASVTILTSTVNIMYYLSGEGAPAARRRLGPHPRSAQRPAALARPAGGARRRQQGHAGADRERPGQPVDRDAVQGRDGAWRIGRGSRAGLGTASRGSAAGRRAAPALARPERGAPPRSWSDRRDRTCSSCGRGNCSPASATTPRRTRRAPRS